MNRPGLDDESPEQIVPSDRSSSLSNPAPHPAAQDYQSHINVRMRVIRYGRSVRAEPNLNLPPSDSQQTNASATVLALDDAGHKPPPPPPLL
jgi:hypothetical protein